MAAHPYITVEDVRHYILDGAPDDNDLILDLGYSDDEIRQAMVRAARDWNSVPPRVSTVEPEKLSAQTNVFLDGIAAQLYIATLAKLTRNDIDYTAGGVSTNIVAKRIDHLKELIRMHKEMFLEAAKSEKLLSNINAGFGHF